MWTHFDVSLNVAGGISCTKEADSGASTFAASTAFGSLVVVFFFEGFFSPDANLALTPSAYFFSSSFCFKTFASFGLGASKFVFNAPFFVMSWSRSYVWLIPF